MIKEGIGKMMDVVMGIRGVSVGWRREKKNCWIE
jgi:hypothetical protein